eukprot:CAMPEP_0115306048 /NCGR_PEP_ID=MMETSP0270-20121206/72363_1 /TAXON_ID=71861 /ORGANISM="Scrippsiella trochoidea, Strain CCMP3099" /LENGTH=91 /DNA_ID=CAMNT_0002724325 /DNA_START=87 /DNA_END=359 /DNA_ORIENTATION=+
MSGMMSIEQGEGTWTVWDGTATQWRNAYKLAEEMAVEVQANEERNLDEDEEGSGARWVELYIWYKSNKDATGTVFTPEMIQEMCRVEATLG